MIRKGDMHYHESVSTYKSRLRMAGFISVGECSPAHVLKVFKPSINLNPLPGDIFAPLKNESVRPLTGVDFNVILTS